MTFGEFKRDIRVELDQHQNTDAGGNHFLLEKDIREGADYVASRTDALFDDTTTSLTESESHYCASDYYRITGITVKDSNGKWQPLWLFDDPGAADEKMGGWWRDTTQEADPPRIAVFNGINSFTLHPTPSTTRAGGLRVEGWRKPGRYWLYTDGAGVALTDAHECPLPGHAHQAVYLYALAQQARRDRRPEIRAQYPDLWALFTDELGTVEGNIATHHNRTAYRANPYDCRLGRYR